MKIVMGMVLIAALTLSGCATVQRLGEDMGNVDTYAKCATADVMTTAFALTTTTLQEVNPLAKALYIKAFGHVMGTVVPLIGLSVAGYYILQWLDKPVITATVAGLTCLTAAHNLWVVIK